MSQAYVLPCGHKTFEFPSKAFGCQQCAAGLPPDNPRLPRPWPTPPPPPLPVSSPRHEGEKQEIGAANGNKTKARLDPNCTSSLAPDDSHYKSLTPEPIAVIMAWGLTFTLGNVVKYIARAGRKEGSPALSDLKKARRYIDFEIERLEGK